MARFPLPPAFSRALLLAHELACSVEALMIVAMCSVENVFNSGRRRVEDEQKEGEDGHRDSPSASVRLTAGSPFPFTASSDTGLSSPPMETTSCSCASS